jgi:hypothetical protein
MRAFSGIPLHRLILPLVLLSLLALGILAWGTRRARNGSTAAVSKPAAQGLEAEASREEVERTCGTCHAYPPPELFPKNLWPSEVARGFRFLEKGSVPSGTPSVGSVLAYYVRRAPAQLPVLEPPISTAAAPVRFERKGYQAARERLAPAIAYVQFVHLSDKTKLDVLACDLANSKVFLLEPYRPAPELRVVTDVIRCPAHAEVIDLDRDGVNDLVIADLGSETSTDERLGGVFWLKGRPDGSYKPLILANGLGRVADVQAADFDGDGDLDLIVAEFGFLATGGILLLENRTTDPDRPNFVPTTVDPRHGPIHVPVADLNGDGRPDFVALISQEHETVVAFLNTGKGRFRPEVIYTAPHPAFGSSGIQLVDLDGDGDLDVLYTNGDSMDSQMLRPYHGVQWLENRGSYPFRYHHLTSLYGAQRALAADLDGDGDRDIVVACFLPESDYQDRRRDMNLDALVIMEQVAPGGFVRHSLETVTCDHVACDLGDFDADGKVDLVTGNFFMAFGPIAIGDHPATDWITLRRNVGRP